MSMSVLIVSGLMQYFSPTSVSSFNSFDILTLNNIPGYVEGGSFEGILPFNGCDLLRYICLIEVLSIK